MNKHHKRISIAALVIIFILTAGARIFAQTGEPLSEVLKGLGPLGVVIDFLRIMGLPGMIFVVWYFDRRQIQTVLDTYRADMDEQREMYKKNSRLVEATQDIGERYAALADDLKDIIIMNTQSAMLLQAELKGRKNGRKSSR